jgi:acyl carrier protein
MSTEERSTMVSRLIGAERRDLTPAERELVAGEIVGFLAEQCDRDPTTVTPDSHLADDLGVDSLTFLELFQELESQYNLEVEIRDVARYARDNPVETVGALVAQICLFLEHKIDLAASN